MAGSKGIPDTGSVVRTVDGGRTWRNVTPPGGESLFLRDVEAFDRDHAVVLAVGGGTADDPTRIYRTADGGATWRVVFQNSDPRQVITCIAFFDHRHGLAHRTPTGIRSQKPSRLIMHDMRRYNGSSDGINPPTFAPTTTTTDLDRGQQSEPEQLRVKLAGPYRA